MVSQNTEFVIWFFFCMWSLRLSRSRWECVNRWKHGWIFLTIRGYSIWERFLISAGTGKSILILNSTCLTQILAGSDQPLQYEKVCQDTFNGHWAWTFPCPRNLSRPAFFCPRNHSWAEISLSRNLSWAVISLVVLHLMVATPYLQVTRYKSFTGEKE